MLLYQLFLSVEVFVWLNNIIPIVFGGIHINTVTLIHQVVELVIMVEDFKQLLQLIIVLLIVRPPLIFNAN